MKIGILSDTHGVFCEEWQTHFDGCDCLIHAGDINTKTCYDKLKNLGIPIYMVRGNSDIGSWATFLPEFLTVSIGGKIFFIVHNKSDLPFDLTDANFIVFGHTHSFMACEQFGKVFLNPGSAGDGRGNLKSMMILELTEDNYFVNRIVT